MTSSVAIGVGVAVLAAVVILWMPASNLVNYFQLKKRASRRDRKAALDSFVQRLSAFDKDKVEAVYRDIQGLVMTQEFPILPEDRLLDDLDVDQGNLDVFVEERVPPAHTQSMKAVSTCADLAELILTQPTPTEMAKAYLAIDKDILVWAQKHGHKVVFKKGSGGQDSRFVYLRSPSGECFTIWIQPPYNGRVIVSAADIETRDDQEFRKDWDVPLSEVGTALDAATQTVKMWMEREQKK